MNDRELLASVRDSFARVRAETPLRQIERRGRAVRMRRRSLSSVVAAVVAGVAAAVALTISPAARQANPPQQLVAWRVTMQPGGVIEVQFSQLKDPDGLQRSLRADGVPAFVRFIDQEPPACLRYPLDPDQARALSARIIHIAGLGEFTHGAVVDIYPSAIPADVGIWLTVRPAQVQGSDPIRLVSYSFGTTLVYASGRCPSA